MPRLILVKHSLPEIVFDRPPSQWRLSAEGRRRCLTLASRLASYYPARVITSPEQKAYETARRVSQKLGVPLLINDRIYEHRRDQVAYLPGEQFRQSVQQMMQRPELRVFGEESAAESLARFSNAIWRLLEQFPSQTLVVVSHGTVISLFAAACCQLEPFELWNRLGLPAYLVLRTPEMVMEDIVDRVTIERMNLPV
ncbi:MAG TPA: histidine phosphatase family protein [Anaerolineaceae bacterium]|nr:histidine phosphatase family protein [Anaerolineaceae bacterium]